MIYILGVVVSLVLIFLLNVITSKDKNKDNSDLYIRLVEALFVSIFSWVTVIIIMVILIFIFADYLIYHQ